MKKLNIHDGDIVRSKISKGIQNMSDLVGMTLGPCGKSVLIERAIGEPLIVDDGRRVAENIRFDDPIEQLAARVCYSVTRKTDEKAGDGTTTSMVLANGLLQSIFENKLTTGGIGTNVDVSKLDEEIQESKALVLKKLDDKAKQVKTEKDLVDIATVSVGDKKLGEIIGHMYHVLGKDGHISMEFNLLSSEIETEIVPGYRFSAGYAASWMITDSIKKICDVGDIDVLVTRHKILEVSQIQAIANIVANSGKNKLLIIAPKFSPSFLKTAYENASRKTNPFYLVAVRAPSRVEEAYKDLAIYVGSKYFSENDDLEKAVKQDLGYVTRAEITDDTTILIEGKGKKEDIQKRIKEVEAEAALQKMPQFRQERYERLSALSGGVGLIKIGAPTDEERNWLKYKIEDAKHATKYAFKEGIVKGGGLTLKEISDELPTGNILKEALLAPYITLKKNAGGNFTVGKNVYDPVAVEKAAIENACSAVSKLMRIGGAIAYKPKDLADELQTLLGKDNQIENDNDE